MSCDDLCQHVVYELELVVGLSRAVFWESNLTIPPRVQALVLADHVYSDETSKKKVISGTFNAMQAKSFPSHLPRPTWAYISLTEIRNALDLELRYVDLTENTVLMKMGLRVSMEKYDPIVSLEMLVEIPPLPMPQAGAYLLELVHDEIGIGSMRVTVSQREPPHDSNS